jgi:hypothetical protein
MSGVIPFLCGRYLLVQSTDRPRRAHVTRRGRPTTQTSAAADYSRDNHYNKMTDSLGAPYLVGVDSAGLCFGQKFSSSAFFGTGRLVQIGDLWTEIIPPASHQLGQINWPFGGSVVREQTPPRAWSFSNDAGERHAMAEAVDGRARPAIQPRGPTDARRPRRRAW